ncbi:hypothetical protein CF319_g3759 [Tilletia indica]|nr:hypothetical protein CF319_g3759 [Tilletia indica]
MDHRFVETNVGSGIFKAVKVPLNTAATLIPVVGKVLVEQFTSRLPSLIGHPLRELNEAAVTADDVIVVDDKYDPESQENDVPWLQGKNQVKTPYIITRFTNLTEEHNPEGILFVEASK